MLFRNFFADPRQTNNNTKVWWRVRMRSEHLINAAWQTWKWIARTKTVVWTDGKTEHMIIIIITRGRSTMPGVTLIIMPSCLMCCCGVRLHRTRYSSRFQLKWRFAREPCAARTNVPSTVAARPKWPYRSIVLKKPWATVERVMLAWRTDRHGRSSVAAEDLRSSQLPAAGYYPKIPLEIVRQRVLSSMRWSFIVKKKSCQRKY